jgi:heme/copper-type cytochrome/quinol oxidase subunit 2
MKEKILCVLEYISWSFLNTAGIMAVLFIGMMISLYIAIFMHVNEEKIGLLSISLSILLVYITAYYAFITHKILKEQNKTRQILAIEKKWLFLRFKLLDQE